MQQQPYVPPPPSPMMPPSAPYPAPGYNQAPPPPPDYGQFDGPVSVQDPNIRNRNQFYDEYGYNIPPTEDDY
ncbi:MAG: hypothetical protein HC915_02210 [Anaerolineae bacterium]|nr:hypothetical protein [Anaerolineae bacterium]